MQGGRTLVATIEEPIAGLMHELRVELQRFEAEAETQIETYVLNVNAQPVPQALYHYTDPAGLRGILESGTLRLGDIFNLNDPSELRYGIGRALTILDETSASRPGEREALQRFARSFRQVMTDGVEEFAHFFVCCFSTCGDDLGQWRAYSAEARGYAIGFDGAALVKYFSTAMGTGAHTFPVAYNEKDLNAILRHSVERAAAAVSFPYECPGRVGEEALRIYMTRLQRRLALLVLQSSLLFKHKAYVNEDEYRLLDLHQIGDVPGVKFGKKPNVLSRYREFNWKSEAHWP
jgi:hypothetical protein